MIYLFVIALSESPQSYVAWSLCCKYSSAVMFSNLLSCGRLRSATSLLGTPPMTISFNGWQKYAILYLFLDFPSRGKVTRCTVLLSIRLVQNCKISPMFTNIGGNGISSVPWGLVGTGSQAEEESRISNPVSPARWKSKVTDPERLISQHGFLSVCRRALP